jgi:hypothetical protein
VPVLGPLQALIDQIDTSELVKLWILNNLKHSNNQLKRLLV